MHVENLPTSTPGSVHDELPKLSEASIPATTSFEASNAFDLSLELAELLASFTPPESINEPSEITQHNVNKEDVSETEDTISYDKKIPPVDKSLDKRENYRHPLHWRVAIVNKSGGKHEIYHGRTYDLSLSGVSILIEQNISFTSEVVILLAIPPMHLGQKETIVEIECSTTYTLLDSVHSQFRLGMKFIHFKRDGKKILSDILSTRHIPKDSTGRYAEAEYFAVK
jgi:hypothetical protein